jgi:hypothetical protein
MLTCRGAVNSFKSKPCLGSEVSIEVSLETTSENHVFCWKLDKWKFAMTPTVQNSIFSWKLSVEASLESVLNSWPGIASSQRTVGQYIGASHA